ncbi:MAG: hypothetical protein Q8Q60_00990 [Candidatus Chromulinivorax sp.]|nr:hypothetical protein [Candidatus Chromulinivorax sp.]
MCKKVFLFFILIVVSFDNQAMFNHGFKNIAVKSMRYNTAVMRAMSSGKKPAAEHSKNYYKAGIVKDCAWIGLLSFACFYLRESNKRDQEMKTSPGFAEDYFENKNKKKHQN